MKTTQPLPSETGGESGPWKVPELLIRFIRVAHDLNRCGPQRDTGLSVQQIRALIYLVHHDGRTIKDLAQALSLSEARSSRVADELVESGHIVSERDEDDRRQVRLHVTPAAAETAEQIYRERSGAVKRALKGASEAEIDAFAHLLERIVEEFEGLVRASGYGSYGQEADISGTAEVQHAAER